MPKPRQQPVGLALSATAKAVSRAFDDALVQAGGSLPRWLILLSLKAGRAGTQSELADAVGIRGATLSHHLAGMEAEGLVVRTRDAENLRAQRVTMTDEGERLFGHLATAARAHDRRLRRGLEPGEVETLSGLLGRLRANVSAPPDPDR